MKFQNENKPLKNIFMKLKYEIKGDQDELVNTSFEENNIELKKRFKIYKQTF